MRVLIVAHQFAPFNASGSIRVTKFAEFLHMRGYDVRVLTCDGLPYPRTFSTYFPDERVVRTQWVNLDGWMQSARRRVYGRTDNVARGANPATQSCLRRIAVTYRALVGFPDPQVGWAPYALSAGRRMLQSWTPNVVFSSALPLTAHLIGSQLSKISGASWIADYRDLFVDNPYQQGPRWRTWIDRKLEAAILKRSELLTTVSKPLADQLAARLNKEVVEIRNGFDPADVLTGVASDAPANRLRILHTGIIYPGRRDPSLLFEAMRDIENCKDINVEFIGQDNRGIEDLLKKYNIYNQVKIKASVSYKEAIRLQAGSDILLLLTGFDDTESGIFTGKFFEYVAAGRPILCIGSSKSEAARAIVDNNLGVVANTSAPIMEALARWRDEKLLKGELKTDAIGRDKFSRIRQFEILEGRLNGLLHPHSQVL